MNPDNFNAKIIGVHPKGKVYDFNFKKSVFSTVKMCKVLIHLVYRRLVLPYIVFFVFTVHIALAA